MTTQWALDLFAGPGGWDVHDVELGITTLRVENDDAARATATAFGLVHTHDDVTTYQIDRQFQGLKASPPCQTFSAAGKGAGRKQLDAVVEQLHRVADGHPLDYAHYDDARTGLVLEPLRIILQAWHLGWPFRWIVMEQVPAVLPVWEEYAKVLAPLGYSVATGNLHAEQYGVPQTRKRAVLIASLGREAKLPTPTHSKYYSRTPAKLDDGVSKWVSMAEALGWSVGDLVGFPRRADTDDVITLDGVDYRARDLRTGDQPAQTVTEKARSWSRFPDAMAGAGQTAQRTSGQRPRSVDESAHTITGAGSAAWMYVNGNQANAARRNLDQPAPTVHFGARSNKVEWQWLVPANGRTRTDGGGAWPRPITVPAPTVTTKTGGQWRWTSERPTEGQTATQSVRVTVEEAAILQTFPADYPWQGVKTKQYQQVGNAIPPLLARAVLQQVI